MDLTVKETGSLSTVIQKRMLSLQDLGLSKPDTEFRYNPPTHDPAGLELLFGVLLKGYISTWDIDEIDDKFVPGAFRESIQKFFIDHTKRFGAPYIKLLREHEELAAIIHYLVEDEKGLYVEFWCLNTDIGRRFYVEVVSGAINQMSIGFIPRETDEVESADGSSVIRLLIKADVLEGSGVYWPCNYATDVGVTTAQSPKALTGVDEKSLPSLGPAQREPETDQGTVDKSITEETAGMKDLCKSMQDACKKCVEKGEKLSAADHRVMVKTLAHMTKAMDACCPDEDETAEDLPKASPAVEEEVVDAKTSEAEPPAASVDLDEPDITKYIASLMEIQQKTLAGVEAATAKGKE